MLLNEIFAGWDNPTCMGMILDIIKMNAIIKPEITDTCKTFLHCII
jgi:hypothetical protein